MRKLYILFLTCFLSVFCIWCVHAEPIPADVDDAGINTFIPNDASVSDGGFDLLKSIDYSINYKGGAVMTKPAKVYIVWYGHWNTQVINLIDEFINNLSDSNYFKINNDYYNIFNPTNTVGFLNNKYYATSNVHVEKEITMDYDYGKVLSNTTIQEIILKSILNNQFPADNDGLYFVFTDKDVGQTYTFSSFCFDYCGWHNFDTYSGVSIKYGFVGDMEKCPYVCSAKTSYLSAGFDHSPNNNWTVDGMVSIIAHEMGEMITDPELNAWQDVIGYENMDHCAWTYGSVYVTNNNSVANIKLGQKDYLIQRNWSLNKKGCSLIP